MIAKVAAGTAAVLLGFMGYAAAREGGVEPFAVESATVTVASTEVTCGDLGMTMSDGECWAAGTIRFVALHNLQGANQFCKWRAANPGEWSRLKGYAMTAAPPGNVVTWLGGAIRNLLEAYFATSAPPFTIEPNTAPNVCRTPLAPPAVQNVTPGETDVTVTVGP